MRAADGPAEGQSAAGALQLRAGGSGRRHAGLVQESLPWYSTGGSNLGICSSDLARPFHARTWAAELYIGDESFDALRMNGALLKQDPTYTPAYFLQLVMARSSGDKDSYTTSLQEGSGNAFVNRVVEACNAVAPEGTPQRATTRPICR